MNFDPKNFNDTFASKTGCQWRQIFFKNMVKVSNPFMNFDISNEAAF